MGSLAERDSMMIGYELGILKAQLFTSRDRARFTTLHKWYYYKALERLVRKLILIANDYVPFAQQPNFFGDQGCSIPEVFWWGRKQHKNYSKSRLNSSSRLRLPDSFLKMVLCLQMTAFRIPKLGHCNHPGQKRRPDNIPEVVSRAFPVQRVGPTTVYVLGASPTLTTAQATSPPERFVGVHG